MANIRARGLALWSLDSGIAPRSLERRSACATVTTGTAPLESRRGGGGPRRASIRAILSLSTVDLIVAEEDEAPEAATRGRPLRHCSPCQTSKTNTFEMSPVRPVGARQPVERRRPRQPVPRLQARDCKDQGLPRSPLRETARTSLISCLRTARSLHRITVLREPHGCIGNAMKVYCCYFVSNRYFIVNSIKKVYIFNFFSRKFSFCPKAMWPALAQKFFFSRLQYFLFHLLRIFF